MHRNSRGLLGYRETTMDVKIDWAEALAAGVVTVVAIAAWWAALAALFG